MTAPLPLLTYEQLAEQWGCTPRLVRKLVETRQLDSVKIGRLTRVEQAGADRYLESHRRVSR